MLHRHLSVALHRTVHRGGAVLVTGPRGAGKTVLLRREFPGHSYASLEESSDRTSARETPDRFLARFRGPAIIDDLHRAPELVAHLAASPCGQPLVFAGSRRLRLPLPTLELHAPTTAERQRRQPVPLEMLGRFVPSAAASGPEFPAWGESRRFLECDVRDLVGVHDMDRFERFLHAARARSGEVLDQQALATGCGVSHRTIARWLEVLDTCFLTLRLLPASDAFGRRLIRRPKLHFLLNGPFESRGISEIYRNACHAGELPDLRYWRDSNGFEIPLVIESESAMPVPVGIAQTPTPREVAELRRWAALAGTTCAALIGEREANPRTGGILRYAITQL